MDYVLYLNPTNSHLKQRPNGRRLDVYLKLFMYNTKIKTDISFSVSGQIIDNPSIKKVLSDGLILDHLNNIYEIVDIDIDNSSLIVTKYGMFTELNIVDALGDHEYGLVVLDDNGDVYYLDRDSIKPNIVIDNFDNFKIAVQEPIAHVHENSINYSSKISYNNYAHVFW